MVTTRELYAFLIHYRPDEGNIPLRCDILFLQFIVNCYATIEAYKLLYMKNTKVHCEHNYTMVCKMLLLLVKMMLMQSKD